MRRDLKKRESIELLENNYIGQLAFIDGAEPYIVPVTYFYDKADHRIISYSSEGQKLRAMRKNARVALNVTEITSIAEWKSVLAHGHFKELEGVDAKHMLDEFAKGVKGIINRTSLKNTQFIKEFSAKTEGYGIPVVFQIKINTITGVLRES